MFILFILNLSFHDGSMIEIYKKQSKKVIAKHLHLDEYETVKQDFNAGELYAIKHANETQAYLLLSEVAACNLGGCHKFEKNDDHNSSEFFDLLVLLDEDLVIKHLNVLEYFSDYGYEITSSNYLKQFIGKNVCSFTQDTDDVDIISGATISSYALEATLGQVCSFE